MSRDETLKAALFPDLATLAKWRRESNAALRRAGYSDEQIERMRSGYPEREQAIDEWERENAK